MAGQPPPTDLSRATKGRPAKPALLSAGAWVGKRRRQVDFVHHKEHEEHKESEDEAADTLAKHRHVEVYEIAQPKTGQTKICNDLRLMKARERLDGLHLTDDGLIDEKIQPIAGVQTPAFIDDRQG